MRATHPFTTALREMRVCVCARACVHVCELRVLSTLLLFLLQFLPEPNADSVWSIRLPICHPAGSQLLTPSMREAIPHEWQPLVIQKATNLSTILKKDFIYQSIKPKRNILKHFLKKYKCLFIFNVYTPWHLFKVDIPGEVTSLKFTCFMFNIHASFKFCGYHGLKIVYSVLCRKIGKLSDRRNCPLNWLLVSWRHFINT